MPGDIEIIRTEGRHGDLQEEEVILQLMGKVSGFIFRHRDEPTVFWMGDTIWYEDLEQLILQYKPEIIICHSGGNKFPADSPVLGENKLSRTSGSLIMDKEQTLALCQLAKDSIVIATHLGALDHETVTRKELHDYVKQHQIDAKAFFIPEDGEVLSFPEELKPHQKPGKYS